MYYIKQLRVCAANDDLESFHYYWALAHMTLRRSRLDEKTEEWLLYLLKKVGEEIEN